MGSWELWNASANESAWDFCPETVSRIICTNCSCLDGMENYSAVVQHFASLIQDTWGEPDIPFGISILLTTVYSLIFATGLLGNFCTCLVIARNRYMQTATNYYLFSLAVSDIMLLVLGTPDDIVRSWFTYPYIFGDTFCRVRGMAAEACTYASILIITAFTVERWVAICHPMCTAHRLFNPTGRDDSRLSQVKMVIVALWVLGFLFAIPQAITFRVIYERLPDGTIIENLSACNVAEGFQSFSKFSFVFSAFFMFVLPMVLITVLYVHIAVSLRQATWKANNDSAITAGGQAGRSLAQRQDNHHHNHKNVITMLGHEIHRDYWIAAAVLLQITKFFWSPMEARLDSCIEKAPDEDPSPNGFGFNNPEILIKTVSQARTYSTLDFLPPAVAVVIAFFVCWAPFHAQRLLALVYEGETDSAFRIPYAALHFTSGIMYYVSATINPILYNILSVKFRKAFQDTWKELCGKNGSSHHRTGTEISHNRMAMQRMSGSANSGAHNARATETTCNGGTIKTLALLPPTPQSGDPTQALI
ncbi:unnamed protein product [Notodromas monacha]|uniref:G-protein coupled receptors family 1 profile domain-containing protein n=1 Tax=Notodromas monacha TaxID=399045 RepID=A0A7R9G9S7_9CRUS|nr:unnamed protein product [Notodromas monacha]CAG0912939.1 unnamed protein product [Notodromas monacha]